MAAREFNFDGLVGPTHNYAGLSFGNVASTSHGGLASNPLAAVLEGLAKMRLVHDLGVGQVVMPPVRRPRLELLADLGFGGPPAQQIAQAAATDPRLLAAAYSAAGMWTANAATVSPSADTSDGRLHITPANLTSTLHRACESSATWRILRMMFANDRLFAVHGPLPPYGALADEGAANHTRLCGDLGQPGLEVFVYGRTALTADAAAPKKFPARQTLEASQAIARRHRLDLDRVVFIQQNPQAIDAGVFHNDVICVGHRDVLIYHETAFVDQRGVLGELASRFESCCQRPLRMIELSEQEISLAESVSSYLFNSQIVTRPDEGMTLIAPAECERSDAARHALEKIEAAEVGIDDVRFVDLRQSMRNGGGPACLRLRVVLTDEEQQALPPGVIFSPELHDRLVDWARRHYREQLTPADLSDPRLLDEVDAALAELATILTVPSA